MDYDNCPIDNLVDETSYINYTDCYFIVHIFI